jgi:cytochrome b6-f complex iron-sulfur subunit
MRRDKRPVAHGLQAIADGRRLPCCRIDDPDDIGALRVAIGLRADRVAADLPSDEFVAALHSQLVNEREPEPSPGNVSRRALFAGVGAAAAAVAAAVIADRTLLPGHDIGQSNNVATELAPDDGQWVAVALEGRASPGNPRRFDTPSVVGFVSGESDNLMAVSGTCTHLGCLLQPNAEAGRLDCPCHRTSFGYDGGVLFSQLNVPLAPLPRIRVRRRDGTVEVLIPRQT